MTAMFFTLAVICLALFTVGVVAQLNMPIVNTKMPLYLKATLTGIPLFLVLAALSWGAGA